MVNACAGPAAGSLFQAVATEPSIARDGPAPDDQDEACTTGGGTTAGSSASFRRASWLTYTEPRPPPRPAATTNSMAAAWRSVRSLLGPHANSMWRFLILTSCHSRGNSKSGRWTHQTFSPLASTSLTWKLL